MQIKFIHCSDLHIGSVFKGLAQTDNNLASSVLEATYKAFDNIIDLAIKEKVKFILMAGDLLDSENQSLHPLLYLLDRFQRLNKEKIKVFLIHGNHDPHSRLYNLIDFPPNVTVFPPDNSTWHLIDFLEGVKVAIWGTSFKNSKEEKNLTTLIPRLNNNYFKIALVHQTVGSQTGHVPYAPCKISDCDYRADYWALGHIHKPRVLSTSPYVVYSGNPQGRNFKETGSRGCFLVQVDNQKNISIDFIETCEIIWKEATIELTPDIDTIDKLFNLLISHLKNHLRQLEPKGLICSLRLTGINELIQHLISKDELEPLQERLNDYLSSENQVFFLTEIKNFSKPLVDLYEREKINDLVGYVLREAKKYMTDQSKLETALAPLLKKKELVDITEQIKKEDMPEIILNAQYLLLDLLEGEED